MAHMEVLLAVIAFILGLGWLGIVAIIGIGVIAILILNQITTIVKQILGK